MSYCASLRLEEHNARGSGRLRANGNTLIRSDQIKEGAIQLICPREDAEDLFWQPKQAVAKWIPKDRVGPGERNIGQISVLRTKGTEVSFGGVDGRWDCRVIGGKGHAS